MEKREWNVLKNKGTSPKVLTYIFINIYILHSFTFFFFFWVAEIEWPKRVAEGGRSGEDLLAENWTRSQAPAVGY